MTEASEYNAIRNGAGVYPRGSVVAKVTGEDRSELLEHALARSIEYFQPGTVMECLALDEQGHPIDQVLALIDDDDVLLLSDQEDGVLPKLADLAEGLGVADASVEILEGWHGVAVEGPAAWKVVESLAEDDIASLALSEWSTTSIDGLFSDGRLARTGSTGEYGYLVVGEADAEAISSKLLELAGDADSAEVSRPVVLRASLEVSHPMYPELFADGVTVAEAGMLWAAGAGREDDFRGKDEVLTEEERTRGVVAVKVPDGDVPAAGTAVKAGDQQVGTIHLTTVRADADHGFGLALLDVPFCVPGLELDADGTTVSTVSRPFAQLRSWTEPIG